MSRTWTLGWRNSFPCPFIRLLNGGERYGESEDRFTIAARRFIAAGLAKANAPGTREIEKLTEIREELRRIGVNLNQIARAMNGGAEAENIKEHLERLALLRERIVRLLRYYYG